MCRLTDILITLRKSPENIIEYTRQNEQFTIDSIRNRIRHNLFFRRLQQRHYHGVSKIAITIFVIHWH